MGCGKLYVQNLPLGEFDTTLVQLKLSTLRVYLRFGSSSVDAYCVLTILRINMFRRIICVPYTDEIGKAQASTIFSSLESFTMFGCYV